MRLPTHLERSHALPSLYRLFVLVIVDYFSFRRAANFDFGSLTSQSLTNKLIYPLHWRQSCLLNRPAGLARNSICSGEPLFRSKLCIRPAKAEICREICELMRARKGIPGALQPGATFKLHFLAFMAAVALISLAPGAVNWFVKQFLIEIRRCRAECQTCMPVLVGFRLPGTWGAANSCKVGQVRRIGISIGTRVLTGSQTGNQGLQACQGEKSAYCITNCRVGPAKIETSQWDCFVLWNGAGCCWKLEVRHFLTEFHRIPLPTSQ